MISELYSYTLQIASYKIFSFVCIGEVGSGPGVADTGHDTVTGDTGDQGTGVQPGSQSWSQTWQCHHTCQ